MKMFREALRPCIRVMYLENVSKFGGPRFYGAILGGSTALPAEQLQPFRSQRGMTQDISNTDAVDLLYKLDF